jgi:hypothetical protein
MRRLRVPSTCQCERAMFGHSRSIRARPSTSTQLTSSQVAPWMPKILRKAGVGLKSPRLHTTYPTPHAAESGE